MDCSTRSMAKPAHILNLVRSTRASGRDFIAGFTEYANRHTQWRFHWEPLGLAALKQPWESYGFDAVVSRDHSAIAPLIESGVPAILLSHQSEENRSTIQIATDDETVASSIARLFDFKGFHHFAFLGYHHRIWSQRRERHFKDTSTELGHSPLCFNLEGELANGDDDCNREELHDWLEALPDKTAIMAANDDLGSLVIRSAQDLGHRIPDDRIVVGVGNDQPICEMTSPALSSAPLHFRAAGTEAAKRLDAIFSLEDTANVTISCATGAVVERQSSEKTAITDPNVARAVTYLNQTRHRPISVNEVATVTGLSRRALEIRFKDNLSTTIASYHRELRANHITTLLERKTLNLEQVAEESGFHSAAELSRFFKAVKNESPSTYRTRVCGS